MESNEGYKKSFEKMTAALSKAMQPLIDVFSQVMIIVYKGITAIANWVSVFNEAYPAIAKVVSGIVSLVRYSRYEWSNSR